MLVIIPNDLFIVLCHWFFESGFCHSLMYLWLTIVAHSSVYKTFVFPRRIKGLDRMKESQGNWFILLLVLLVPLNGLFSKTTWTSQYQKGKTSLDLNEARDYGISGCSSISWTICKQSVPRSRQITTPTPHHSIFTDWMLFLTPSQQCQSTEGKVIN